MNKMEIMCELDAFSLYSQIAFIDAASKDSYPQWKTGLESIVFNSRGIAVATASDQSIKIVVCRGDETPEHVLCISGEINIEDQGVIIGNIPAATVKNFLLEKGKYYITIYTNGNRSTVTEVWFFVTPMVT
jgi:hypothetical protein